MHRLAADRKIVGSVTKSSTKGRDSARRAPDGAVYIGLLMIGLFGVWLWTIAARDPDSWKHGLLGYLIAMAVLLNLYTWRACRGKHLVAWQRALARLPLRLAGYGSRGGRPLEAAHGSPRAMMMLYVSIATCAVVIAGLTFLLIP